MSTRSNLQCILPHSMYLSGQLTLHTTREDYDALLLRRPSNLPGRKIKVQRIVEIQTYKSRPALIPSHTERQGNENVCMWSGYIVGLLVIMCDLSLVIAPSGSYLGISLIGIYGREIPTAISWRTLREASVVGCMRC